MYKNKKEKKVIQTSQRMYTYLKLQLKRAYNCCLQGPQSSLACEQEHLEKSPSESSARRNTKNFIFR